MEFTGDNASGHIAGAVLGKGASHIDNTIFVTHGAEGCESRQVFKHVLTGKARGIFQGKIFVRKGAQKTDGYQISQAVLLSEGAQFSVKPELEIYADDVKCSHGPTPGKPDEAAGVHRAPGGGRGHTAAAGVQGGQLLAGRRLGAGCGGGDGAGVRELQVRGILEVEVGAGGQIELDEPSTRARGILHDPHAVVLRLLVAWSTHGEHEHAEQHGDRPGAERGGYDPAGTPARRCPGQQQRRAQAPHHRPGR